MVDVVNQRKLSRQTLRPTRTAMSTRSALIFLSRELRKVTSSRKCILAWRISLMIGKSRLLNYSNSLNSLKFPVAKPNVSYNNFQDHELT